MWDVKRRQYTESGRRSESEREIEVVLKGGVGLLPNRTEIPGAKYDEFFGQLPLTSLHS